MPTLKYDFWHGRWFRALATTELKKIVSYRVDFWSRFIGRIAANFCVTYFLWKALFETQSAPTLGGYSLHGMVLYSLIAPTIFSVVVGDLESIVADEIYSGSINRYLIYPVPAGVSFFLKHFCGKALQGLQLVVISSVALSLSGVPDEFHITSISIGIFTLSLAIASVMAFALLFAIDCVAFWADSIWSLRTLFRFLANFFSGYFLPLTLFPNWFHSINKFLPFRYMLSVPMEVLVGKLSLDQWVRTLPSQIGWTVVLIWLAGKVWNLGRETYSGVGM